MYLPEPWYGNAGYLLEIASSDVTRDGAMQIFRELRREAKESGAADMTLDEINREIDFARQGAAG